MPLSSLNTNAQEEQAGLSPDELTIYFSTNRDDASHFDIYRATRTSTALPFGDVTPVTSVNTQYDEREPRVSADALSLYAITARPARPGLHIFLATRDNTTLAFDELKEVANVNYGNSNDDSPYLPTANVMYLSSDRFGSFDLYRSVRSGGEFSTPTPVPGIDLNTTVAEGNPVLTPDELTMLFTSTRAGGTGNWDIYETTRETTTESFRAPTEIAGLNTTDLDAPTWVSPDGCNLYLTRIEAIGGRQLYFATRSR